MVILAKINIMASLLSLNEKLGIRRAKHFLRRATYNFSKVQIEKFASITAEQAVEILFENTTNKLAEPYDPLPSNSPDGYWTSSTEHPNTFDGQGRKRAFVTAWWWYNAINEVSFKHKLSFFLHTCFTAAKDSGGGFSTNYFDHLRLLDFYAYGNIKTLAQKITLDNSMLNYLDNTNNNANNPNENYAREFLELFTILKGPQIGEGNYTNYTEIDVQQAAKVFSGFKREYDRSIIDSETNLPSGYANKNKHDKNDKQFSQAFDNQIISGKDDSAGMMTELSDFISMVFSKEETAKSYCRKLYRHFVKSEWGEEVENDIISPLAKILIENNYEIKPVVSALFSSQHFFDADDDNASNEIIGSIIKSPFQQISEICSMFQVTIPNPNSEAYRFYINFFLKFVHNSYLGGAGMSLFNPDSVAGYPAYYQEPDFDRHWFSSNTLIARYKLVESLIYGKYSNSNQNNYSKLDTILFVENNIENPSDSVKLIMEISDLLFPESIDEDRIKHFESILLDGYNSYYWSSEWTKFKNTGDASTIKSRLDALIIAIINAAEFQLM